MPWSRRGLITRERLPRTAGSTAMAYDARLRPGLGADELAALLDALERLEANVMPSPG
jgi:hypothetical protein